MRVICYPQVQTITSLCNNSNHPLQMHMVLRGTRLHINIIITHHHPLTCLQMWAQYPSHPVDPTFLHPRRIKLWIPTIITCPCKIIVSTHPWGQTRTWRRIIIHRMTPPPPRQQWMNTSLSHTTNLNNNCKSRTWTRVWIIVLNSIPTISPLPMRFQQPRLVKGHQGIIPTSTPVIVKVITTAAVANMAILI